MRIRGKRKLLGLVMPRRAGRTRRWWRARLRYNGGQCAANRAPKTCITEQIRYDPICTDASGVTKTCTACYGVRATTPVQSYAAMDYDNQNTDSWNDRWGVDPAVDINRTILQQITDAGRPPLEASIPAQAGRTCGKMNDNCIEAMVFGNVLDAEGQAALGLGYNLDMWIRQDPTHAATFPWGTQQWNGVSGTNGEFLSFQNDGPDCKYDEDDGATANTGCVTNGYSQCTPGESLHNPTSGNTYTYCDYSKTGSTGSTITHAPANLLP